MEKRNLFSQMPMGETGTCRYGFRAKDVRVSSDYIG